MTAGTRIAALQEPGIDMTPSYNRVYPSGDMAANFVGFTDLNSGQTNLIGEAGLEQEYNAALAGRGAASK